MISNSLSFSLILFLQLFDGIHCYQAPCGQSGDTTYTDDHGITYNLDCGVTLTMNVNYLYSSHLVPDLATCANICSDWTIGGPLVNCNAAIFADEGDDGNVCELVNGQIEVEEGNDDIALLPDQPQTYPATPISFNASCDSDNFKHYTDPVGDIYFIMCEKMNAASQLTNVSFSPHTFAGCIHACSVHNHVGSNQPAGICTGVSYDADQQICNIDTANLTEALDDSGNSAYIVHTAQICDLNSTASTYTTAENDTLTVGHIAQSDVVILLSSSDQFTPCGCADQCSLYNRAYPNTTIPCAGAEFNPYASPNCLIKSN